MISFCICKKKNCKPDFGGSSEIFESVCDKREMIKEIKKNTLRLHR